VSTKASALLLKSSQGLFCSRIHLTEWNVCATIYSSGSGFACTAPRLAGCPDRVTVPAWNVVYYYHQLQLEQQQENHYAQYVSTCVLHVKQVPIQDSVSWNFLSIAVLRKTGEEALPPSDSYRDMSRLPGFETGTASGQVRKLT
jgi:hypothetical protein